jgi:hypothetical protein
MVSKVVPTTTSKPDDEGRRHIAPAPPCLRPHERTSTAPRPPTLTALDAEALNMILSGQTKDHAWSAARLRRESVFCPTGE